VCGVWNGYNGDSEIVKVLDRQTALKRWIAAEISWYRNVVYYYYKCTLLLLLRKCYRGTLHSHMKRQCSGKLRWKRKISSSRWNLHWTVEEFGLFTLKTRETVVTWLKYTRLWLEKKMWILNISLHLLNPHMAIPLKCTNLLIDLGQVAPPILNLSSP